MDKKSRLDTAKCICGNRANLHYIIKLGRAGEQLVTVHDVPTYICTDCEMRFTDGPDSLLYAERVSEAVRLGIDEIQF